MTYVYCSIPIEPATSMLIDTYKLIWSKYFQYALSHIYYLIITLLYFNTTMNYTFKNVLLYSLKDGMENVII